MPVTLEWLLAQPELHLRRVGGDTASPVTWAHPTDLSDPTPFLSGGELVLTTGQRLPSSRAEQDAYVERLAAAGVAGVGFGVGLQYDQIPRGVVDACSRLDLALVEVPLPTPFIAITQAVARRLSEEETEGLQRTLGFQRRITRSAVRGGLPALVSVLSRELHCDAVVLDEYGAVMATSRQDASLLELVDARWREFAAHGRAGAAGVATGTGTLEIQTLRGRSAVVGWLVVRLRAMPSSTDRLLLNQAAGLVTLQLDWPAELIAAYHGLGGTLLDLLLDPGQPAGTLVPHLRHFGFGPSDTVMLAVATAPRSHARLLDVVNDRLEAIGRPHVVTRVDKGVAALLPARDARLLVDLLDEAVRHADVRSAVIGVSGPLSQRAVASGLAPAEQAAAAASREQRSVGWFDDLTLGTVIADEAVRSRVWQLAGPALDSLVDNVTQRESDLLPSLDAYLHHNGSWEGAARALGVHRHTLRSRIARVQELTGLDLDVAENRAMLLLALMSRPGCAPAHASGSTAGTAPGLQPGVTAARR